MKVFESTAYPPHLPAHYKKLVPLVQINLNDEPLAKNIEFMKLLFGSDIPGASKRFHKIDDTHYTAQNDNDMDLEKFTNTIKQPWHIVLQVGDPNPNTIVFGASFDETPNFQRLAWFICPYDDRNLEEVRKLFKQVYKQEI